ncbi:hypothetical protein L1049_011224 [Liquidambar formosana]|uniref:DC1 domain-containing protein n=1 Tax=Liquidambar formosana TaxID=63359 RepID=A0AAP0WXZ0_LIQFO
MNYQHFDHHHLLNPLKLDEGEKISCKVCERLIFEPFHGCIECKYYLHDQCLNSPRWLQHPSHPSHSLTLFPSPTYSSRAYTCNACGLVGNAFSLSCAECEFDLHVHCANLPSTLLLDAHPHELKLIFDSPYDENTTFSCDVCSGEADRRYWVYYCSDCDFGTHLECARPELNHLTTDEVVDQLQTDQPSATYDALDSFRQSVNETLRVQNELAQLQNKVNLNLAVSQLMMFKPYR